MPQRSGRRPAVPLPATRAPRPVAPRILLVDDHPIWRDSLRRLLERKRAGKIVGEASNGEAAMALAARERPDVVIMDVDIPAIDGIEATRRIHSAGSGAKVLFLSALDGKDDVIAAVRAGASGYLLKTADPSDVVQAVGRVHAGELVFPPSLASIVLNELRGLTDNDGPGSALVSAHENVFIREGEFWTLSYEGETVRMKDSKGLRYIADLLGSPREGIHVMELVVANEGLDASRRHRGEAVGLSKDLGASAGGLDPKARAAYRSRLEELREHVEEAESWNDTERAARAREEMDFLAGELARAIGLGGRDRKTGSPSERMRVNVSRAISAAVKRIEVTHSSLAAHLAASVKTGTFCSYEPSGPVAWKRS